MLPFVLSSALHTAPFVVPRSLQGRLWRGSGAFLQASYDQVLEACGQDASLAFMYGGWTEAGGIADFVV